LKMRRNERGRCGGGRTHLNISEKRREKHASMPKKSRQVPVCGYREEGEWLELGLKGPLRDQCLGSVCAIKKAIAQALEVEREKDFAPLRNRGGTGGFPS